MLPLIIEMRFDRCAIRAPESTIPAPNMLAMAA